MKYSFFLLCLTLALSSACNGDDDDGPTPSEDLCALTIYSERTSEQLDALTDRATTFSSDPSAENCEAYREALSDYLDLLRSFGGCALIVDQTDYQETLNETEREINDLNC